MPHQPMILTPNAAKGGGSYDRGAPEPELVGFFGISCSSSAFMQNGIVEVQVRAVLQRHAPEPARRKARLDHAGRADPQRRQHRIGQRVGVKQRQIGLVHVTRVQVLMRGVDLGAPQRVGVGPQHRLRPRRGARGVLHAAGGERIGRAPWTVGTVELNSASITSLLIPGILYVLAQPP